MTNVSQTLLPSSRSFVGREHELAHLSTMLHDPACRLLTLVGAGGIGKTRLSLELVARHAHDFEDGTWFVSLQPVQESAHLVTAIASVVNCPLNNADDPRERLLAYLRTWHALLVLDNFEHLLVGAELLSAIVAAASEVKLLVTSREVLNTQDEWRYALGGLALPMGNTSAEVDQSSAVQLFTQRAQQRRPGFSLDAERDHVFQICRLVDGMPLALELAAAWVDVLLCATIAAEITHNLDLLTTRLRDIPARHRSMRAVLTHSWQRLTSEEQRLFARLSVFQGGFTYEAAHQVAGATPSLFVILGDTALLHTSLDGRSHLHELLRQYAEEQLIVEPAEAAQARQAHARYYTAFLAQRTHALSSAGQREGIAEIALELPNIYLGWQWAVKHADLAAIAQMAHVLHMFYQLRGRYREGAVLMAEAVQALSRHDQDDSFEEALVLALTDLGFFQLRLGQLPEAQANFEHAQELLDRTQRAPPTGTSTDPFIGLGFLALIRADYPEAAHLAAAIRQHNVASRSANVHMAWYIEGQAALAQGQYVQAQDAIQQALMVLDTLGDRWFRAYCLNDMSTIACMFGEYHKAQQDAQESYTIREAFGDAEGMAVARALMGKIALMQGHIEEARHWYEHSLALYQDLDDRGGLAVTLNGLGMTACAQRAFQDAQSYLRQALQIAADMQFVLLKLVTVTSSATLLLQTGHIEHGHALLACVLHHPTCDQEVFQRASQTREQFRAIVDSATFAAAEQRGRALDLDAAVLLAQQAIMLTMKESVHQAVVSTSAPASPTLSGHGTVIDQDALTERELEILRLIAEGCSNQEIATRLVLAVSTVKWYTNQMYSKLGVRSRTQALAQAHTRGVLT